MKYCSKCGNEIFDDTVICPHCGCYTDDMCKNKKNSEYKTTAMVFMIVRCAIVFIISIATFITDGFIVGARWFLPLLWCVPMTIVYSLKTSDGEEVGLCFKILSLIFVSVVAGIVMLCDKTE